MLNTTNVMIEKNIPKELFITKQELEMGSGSYWKDVAIPSGYNLLTDPGSHDDMPYEQDATKRGNDYMDSHTTYPSTGYGTPS